MNNHSIIVTMISILWCLLACSAIHMHDIKLLLDSSTGGNSKKYCGRYLTEALATICEGNYQTMRPVRVHKKSYWKSQLMYESINSGFSEDYPFQSKQQATSLVGNYGRERRRRGVYNECCEKSCSIDQLRMYCAAPSTLNPSR